MRRISVHPGFDWILIALFCIAIALPGLAMVAGEGETLSNREKRRLAPAPEFGWQGLSRGSYQQSVDDWLQDHLGLRSWILDAARVVREGMFRKSISDDVVIGREGWRFINVDGALFDYLGLYAPSDTEVDGWLAGLNEKRQWLSELGVPYLLVPIPGKLTMFPEYLPGRIQRRAGETRLAAFRQRFDALPVDAAVRSHVLDASLALDKSATELPLYFQSDTHWTDMGAYRVYAATVDHLRRWLPDLYLFPESQLRQVPKQKEGDIARASGLPVDWTEESVALEKIGACVGEKYREVTAFLETDAYRQRPKRLPVVSGCPDRRYRALVVHDSFGQYLKKFLNESFAEVVYMPSYDVAGMRSFIEEFAPDVYIDFRVERRFHLLLQPGELEDN